MDVFGRKRKPSEDLYVPQSKRFVSQKMIEKHDCDKMKEIHSKTLELLFKGARLKPSEMKPKAVPAYVLSGNGMLSFRNFTDSIDNLSMDCRKSVCCNRQAYICGTCSSCSAPLCEHCGYSCEQCNEFVCSNCLLDIDQSLAQPPLCKECTVFC